MWEMIREFRTVTSKRNMPFRQMITQMCIKAKVKMLAFDKMMPPNVGPITAGSNAKSRSMSQSATSSTTTQEPKAKDLKTRMDEWFLILLCQQNDIANEQKKYYNSLRHRVDFSVTELEKLGNGKYEIEFGSKEEEEEEGNEEEESEEK